ncbi:DNA-binding transcriptional response regulator [Thermobifida cellulosilytica]|uniref:Chemotaxis protein CheY n=1 Tax=Thermobifida cellulosilytica TB100 TaxID=665004 RepID=A0A147KJQ8_THECS|nr:response regulator transcription factor [Thermobifida cellulosilytica]KUP97526.1 chemotaxis protein CheY [Thermobifida cellulosilytica TB100]
MANTGTDKSASMRVLVYSDDASVREQVRLAIGRRPAADVPRVEFVECATAPAVLKRLEETRIDVAIFDGEARPAGGMGLCRQVKDEIFECPPVLLVVGRRDDRWLASWSRADKVVGHPIDPVALAESLAELMRDRVRRLAAAR